MIKIFKKYTRLFIVIGIVLIISNISNLKTIPKKVYDYEVVIHRDKWGVPHIYGNTDEDVAYGLAYSHAEDDFDTIFEILLASRGISASINGKESAP
ncbi:MAG: penicillin amidase, partial [Candidatus Marinimicrobia bacterium]|nr:penicillin amidase [Candidatus Neomarinimicrobiota bacterium]